MNIQCPICHYNTWELVYSGEIRGGEGAVWECFGCHVQRLENFYTADNYESQYRQDVPEYEQTEHIETIEHYIENIGPIDNKKILDVGCGNGLFMDMVSNRIKVDGVEPNSQYRKELRHKFNVYENLSDVDKLYDIVTCFTVIEHVENPREFISQIRQVMKPGGRLYIITPNRDELLMQLYPNYKRFWYRKVHNWYFDSYSLGACANWAGLQVTGIRTLHRRGLSNALQWLSTGEPAGDKPLPWITDALDEHWRRSLTGKDVGEKLLLSCIN